MLMSLLSPDLARECLVDGSLRLLRIPTVLRQAQALTSGADVTNCSRENSAHAEVQGRRDSIHRGKSSGF